MNFNGTCSAVIKAEGSTWNFYTRTRTLQIQGRSSDKIRKDLLKSFNIDEEAAVFDSNEVIFEIEVPSLKKKIKAETKMAPTNMMIILIRRMTMSKNFPSSIRKLKNFGKPLTPSESTHHLRL